MPRKKDNLGSSFVKINQPLVHKIMNTEESLEQQIEQQEDELDSLLSRVMSKSLAELFRKTVTDGLENDLLELSETLKRLQSSSSELEDEIRRKLSTNLRDLKNEVNEGFSAQQTLVRELDKVAAASLAAHQQALSAQLAQGQQQLADLHHQSDQSFDSKLVVVSKAITELQNALNQQNRQIEQMQKSQSELLQQLTAHTEHTLQPIQQRLLWMMVLMGIILLCGGVLVVHVFG